MRVTLPETTIFAPENWCLESVFPFGTAYFHGLLLSVSGRLNLEKNYILDPDELEKLDEKFTTILIHFAWNMFLVELVGSKEKESKI